jgi:aminopeptidase-like protein
MLPAECRPIGPQLRNVLELGAVGVVSDYLRNRYEAPDGVAWANGNTMGGRWHFSIAEKNYLGFNVSPRVGDKLREALRIGGVVVKAECDGRILEADLPTVTATIKGRSSEEVWLISHLYEPLADDNSSGVCACIEVAKQLKKLISTGILPQPEYTLRVVFSLELHGFAAATDMLKDKKVIGAINMDAMPLRHGEDVMRLYMSPPPLPSMGNALMRETVSKLKGVLPWQIKEFAYGEFQDDQAISDPMVGIPVLWPMHPGQGRHWHNSAQTLDIISPDNIVSAVSFVGCWAAAMLYGVSSDGKALGEIYLDKLKALAESGSVTTPGVKGVRTAVSKADYAGKINYIL